LPDADSPDGGHRQRLIRDAFPAIGRNPLARPVRAAEYSPHGCRNRGGIVSGAMSMGGLPAFSLEPDKSKFAIAAKLFTKMKRNPR
jgi:hypothetical protein